MRRYAPLSHEHDPPAATAWGGITGTLSAQTDLQTALDGTVKLTGDQTITGVKTFSNDVHLQGTGTTLPGHFFTGTLDGANVYFHVGTATATDKILNLRVYNAANGYGVYTFTPTAAALPGDLSFSGTLNGGTVPWARVGGWTNNTWLNDAASSPRLFLGTGDTGFGEVRRLSHASQRYIFRDVSDGDRFTIENNGNTTINSSGTSGWLRLQNAGVTRAYFYTDTATKFGFLNAVGTWAVRWNQSGAMEVGTVPANLITGSHTRLQSDGLSTSWNVTSGVNTGAFNAVMGTGTSATWLWSGTSGGTFRAGYQVLDGGNVGRFYVGTHNYEFNGGNFNFPGTLLGGTVPWARLSGAPAADQLRKTTVSTSAPSGGANGDVWLRY